MRIRALILLTLTIALGWSCRRDDPFVRRGVDLRFSQDTIFLDTVFNQVGSSTRTLRVKNPSSENIYVDRIFLAKGPSSYYRLNVNGTPTKDITDVEILANDSITIFIEVTADVGLANEILYTDSIVFRTVDREQDVDLVTLAKDAHFYYPTNTLVIEQPAPLPDIEIPYSILDCNTTWSTDKPHVIYGYAVVDSGCVLTVDPGAEVHFHNGSGIWVTGGGQLLVDPNNNGQFDANPAIFQGDRLEPAYENIPGQWGGILGGIFIQGGSTGNLIQNALIKNATIGVRVDSTNSTTPNLIIRNSQILNHSRVGIYGGFANIRAENVVIGDAGLYGLYGLGGRYDFTHCTFANYIVSGRSTPTIGLYNYFEGSGGAQFVREVIQADFKNSIIYGNRRVEFGVGYDNRGDLNFSFTNSLIRLAENPQDGAFDRLDPTLFINCTLDEEPLFVNRSAFDYQLDSLSPAIDAANAGIAQGVPTDIVKISRLPNPDMGAYER